MTIFKLFQIKIQNVPVIIVMARDTLTLNTKGITCKSLKFSFFLRFFNNIFFSFRYENCPKNPRNARFINLIAQLTSANEQLQLEIKNLNISLEVSNSSRTNESLKDNDINNEIFDKFETKERECSELVILQIILYNLYFSLIIFYLE